MDFKAMLAQPRTAREHENQPLLMAAPAPRLVLTDDQDRALESILAWIRDPAAGPAMLLSGSAGTGKSTLVQEVVRECGVPCVLTAPTNKAALVLKRMAAKAGIRVQCLTAHSANGLRLEDDDEEKYAVKAGEGKLDGVRLVVADEASMIDERLFREFMEAAEFRDLKVLFVGDPLQLPPIKSVEAPAFRLERRAELTQIVRQAADNPIVQMGEWLRKLIRGEPAGPMPTTPGDGPGIHTLRRDEFEARMVGELAARTADGRAGTARGIAFTNRQVDHLAELVRRKVHGTEHPPAYVMGERVFAMQPWGPLKIDFEAEVTAVKDPIQHFRAPDWTVVPLELSPEHTIETVHAYAIHPDQRAQWEGYVDSERDRIVKVQKRDGKGPGTKAMWRTWHQFKDLFASLRPVHAITAHRSQGSTFDEVFVDVPDMQGAARLGGDKYKYRLMYVAITRAAERAWLSW